MHSLRAAYEWCFANGVPGNTVASALWISVGVGLDRLLLRPARKRRERLLDETHRLLHHVHPEKAAELGHAVPDQSRNVT
ncbi:MAG TPA: hypothetical protein VGL75_00960 [Acidothermaceae bacterium]|jgi:hypothetical protein